MVLRPPVASGHGKKPVSDRGCRSSPLPPARWRKMKSVVVAPGWIHLLPSLSILKCYGQFWNNTPTVLPQTPLFNDLKGPHERRMPHLQKIRRMERDQPFATILFRTLQTD